MCRKRAICRGEMTHLMAGETTELRGDSGAKTTQGEMTQGERESRRNDPLPSVIAALLERFQ